jgi:hypothetical protein
MANHVWTRPSVAVGASRWTAALGHEGNIEAMAMYAGQGVGAIDAVERGSRNRRALRPHVAARLT